MATESPVLSALSRAAVYRTFAAAFQTPTEAGLRTVCAVDDFATLTTALHCAGSPVTGDVRTCLERLRTASRCVEPLTAQYWRVFGHTARGLVCPCETEYGDGNQYQQPQQLADISGYYLAFGLTPLSATELRQDHVACECEFMVFLNLKQTLFLEGCAGTADGAVTLEVTRRAERTFLRDHLGRFGRAFASTLASSENGPYYSAWGTLFLHWLELEHTRLHVDIAPGPLLPLRTEFSDDAPMACGSAGDLIQILRP